ncbi:hypothetical protein GFS31_17500 [Leptolyngbya sp. BL0902]|nr:hypothetical protein GFS31_17500 [Leptolyngbya sp. BL0902]
MDELKQTLYAAGVSTLHAAQAQEEMLTTALEALTDAYESPSIPQLEATTDSGADLQPILNALRAERQQALAQGHYEAYVAAETKLQHLDELRVAQLERQVRELTAQQQLDHLTQAAGAETVDKAAHPWTEASLKARYATLGAVKAAFSIKPRSWKEAVQLLNQ